jgi:hypothetical protein
MLMLQALRLRLTYATKAQGECTSINVLPHNSTSTGHGVKLETSFLYNKKDTRSEHCINVYIDQEHLQIL